MSMWSKLVTAIRGGVNDAGEAIIDHQAIRILDQEIRDADNEMSRSKEALTSIIAKRKLADKKVADIKAKVAEYEGYAIKAMESGNESLALEVAEKISGLETELATEEATRQSYQASEVQLRKAVSTSEANLKRLKQQVDTVRATESVQRAQAAVAARHSGANSSMRNAVDSLERLKQRQAERAAQFEAASELAGDGEDSDLDQKLKAAGVISGESSANDVLARLKAKKSAED